VKHYIELTLMLEVEYDGEYPAFYFEEHRCIDDFIEQAAREVKAAGEKGTCTCWRSEVKYLGTEVPKQAGV
jgi:hypothetical protein